MFEIFVIIIMAILIYIFIRKKQSYNKEHKKKIYKKKSIIYPNNEIIINKTNKLEPNLNSDLVEIQYHVDYSDTITAINALTPQKELFNLSFSPVETSVPKETTTNQLVSIFMNSLNDEIKKTPQFLNVNSGWNNMNMRQREKSNQEKQLESIGITSKLYNTPAQKEEVILLKIDKAEQYSTDTQYRIEVHIIVQKKNVSDQMVLMVQFFMEKEDNDTRDKFFDKKLSNDDFKTTVLIERIFIVGFLTNKSLLRTKMEKFYEYDENIIRNDGTMNQEKVLKMMIQKHKDRDDALNSFTQTLDKDVKETHYKDCKGEYNETRTIVDDYVCKYPEYK